MVTGHSGLSFKNRIWIKFYNFHLPYYINYRTLICKHFKLWGLYWQEEDMSIDVLIDEKFIRGRLCVVSVCWPVLVGPGRCCGGDCHQTIPHLQTPLSGHTQSAPTGLKYKKIIAFYHIGNQWTCPDWGISFDFLLWEKLKRFSVEPPPAMSSWALRYRKKDREMTF